MKCAAASSKRSSTRSSDRTGKDVSAAPGSRMPAGVCRCWTLCCRWTVRSFAKVSRGGSYAGPTLALELSGSTAWLAGHANPAELAGFLSFCGCESAILDEAVCPPPDGWRKAETLTVFGLPQAGPLPLPAVDESLWTQLTLCREASAARVAEALYPADLTRQADFYSELCTKRSRGRAVAWTLEQGSTVVCTVGAYACAMGKPTWPAGRPQSAAGQGHRRAAHCGNG